jgi:guanylate kinase
MAEVYLAVPDKDQNRLHSTLSRRHRIHTEGDIKSCQYVLFDPATLGKWKDLCQENPSIDFIALSQEENPFNSGVKSYFNRPYKVHHVMNLLDRINRYNSQGKKQNVFFLHSDEEFLDSCREKLSSKYEIMTARSSEAFYEMIWSNTIDVSVIEDNSFKKSIIKHIKEIMPFSEIITTNKDIESLEDKIAKNVEHKQIIKEKFAPRNPKIYAFMGPRAAGKTTLVDNLTYSIPHMYKAIRVVGRNPRPYEIQGEDHIFMSDEQIKEHASEWLIYKHTKGYLVGIDLNTIHRELEKGKDVLMTIAGTSFYDELSKNYPNMKSLAVLAMPKDLEARSKIRDTTPETLSYSKDDYQYWKDFTKKNSIPVIYNHEPWAELHNPSYSPSYREFKAISSFVKKARQYVLSDR